MWFICFCICCILYFTIFRRNSCNSCDSGIRMHPNSYSKAIGQIISKLHSDWTKITLWHQAVTYVSLVTSFVSVWSTLVASVDRVTVLCCAGRTSFSTRTKARFVCAGLLWFALPVYLNISILIDVTDTYIGPVCVELPQYYDMMQVQLRLSAFTLVMYWISGSGLPDIKLLFTKSYSGSVSGQIASRNPIIISAGYFMKQDLQCKYSLTVLSVGCSQRSPTSHIAVISICVIVWVICIRWNGSL